MADSIIKLVGIGGCGISIINSIVDKNIKGVECIAIDANKRALDISNAQKKLLIGEKSVDGLGSGGAPEVGENAANKFVQMLSELVYDDNIKGNVKFMKSIL